MNDDNIMFILEAIAYISASLAACVYIWETCIINKYKRSLKRSLSSDDLEAGIINRNRRHVSNSSMFDDFN
jgi:hypothetical protein